MSSSLDDIQSPFPPPKKGDQPIWPFQPTAQCVSKAAQLKLGQAINAALANVPILERNNIWAIENTLVDWLM